MNRTLVGAFCALFALAGCSSSTKNSNSDGGDDGGVSYGGDDASEGGGEGGTASDASDAGPAECVPPANATAVQHTEAGAVGCQPNRAGPFQCPSLVTMYKLECTAPDPNDIPSPPVSGCNFAPNMSAAALYYCCPCP
jgi:hypothetical protein